MIEHNVLFYLFRMLLTSGQKMIKCPISHDGIHLLFLRIFPSFLQTSVVYSSLARFSMARICLRIFPLCVVLSASYLYYVCVISLLCLRHIFIMSASYLYYVCVISLLCLRHIFIMSASYLCYVCVISLLCLRHIFIMSASYLYYVCVISLLIII